MQKNKIIIAVCLLIAIFMVSVVVAKPLRGIQCNDGIDNDRDGQVDMDDPECFSDFDNDESVGYPDCSDKNPKVVQKCCQNWADENGIFIIMCVGKWVIVDDRCAWSCDIQII